MNIVIQCRGCGHPIELSQAYEDYQGEVRCWSCRTIMVVTLRDGKLAAMASNPPGGACAVVRDQKQERETAPGDPLDGQLAGGTR